jgi:uncharacterized membrane protein
VNRRALDAFAAHHRLDPAAIDALLEFAGARPSAGELTRFTIRLLQLAGVLSLAAGVIFFVAANWQELGVAGRFALVESVLAACIALALWKPPPASLGRYALLLSFVATGALLALFGQTYQTGADIYELFLAWALLGVPFVAAGRWSVIAAAWLVVFDVALLLFFGWRPLGGWLWLLAETSAETFVLLLAPLCINGVLWVLAEYLRRVHAHPLAPNWIARIALVGTFGFATWAATDAVTHSRLGSEELAVLIAVIAVESAIVAYAWRRRSDVFPLALAAASGIVMSTCALARHLGTADGGTFFMLALWLVVASTLSGRVLMSLVRAWDRDEELA